MPWTSIQLELARPWWLFGLAVLPILAWYYRRSLVDFARWQRLLSLAVRGLIVTLLLLALGGLAVLAPTRELYVVFVVDRSRSIDLKAKQAADDFVRQAAAHAGGNRFVVLPFAARPGTACEGTLYLKESAQAREQAQRQAAPAAPGAGHGLDPDPPGSAGLDRDGTDLAAALEIAAAIAPPFYVPRIVLVSDGVATTGDAQKAAAALQGKIPVDIFALPGREALEVQLSGVVAPAQVRQGEPFHVEIVIDSNHDGETGTLEVYRGDIKAADQKIKLKKGENRLILKQTIDAGGLVPITARLKGCQDTLVDNNSNFALVSAQGKPRVLLLESDPGQARQLVWALREQNIQLEVRPARGAPETLAELSNYDALILSNVPATALSLRQMDAARTYVRDLGGGLIMLGGDQSFGLGGYYKTALEEILPVRSDFQK